MSKITITVDRRNSRERYDAYLRGEYISPVNPPQISEEVRDKMLDMLAGILAKEYRKEVEKREKSLECRKKRAGQYDA